MAITTTGDLFFMSRLLLFALFAFLIAISATPLLTHYLYKHKFWKLKARDTAPDGSATPVFNKLHEQKEVGTPRMGGLLIWVVVAIVVLTGVIIEAFNPQAWHWNFLSRRETWLPLFTLIVAGIIGAVDDVLTVKAQTKHAGWGLSFRWRAFLVSLIGLAGAWWFVFKLGYDSIYLPGAGDVHIGLMFIPFFIIVMLATFSSGVVDGLDGLSGGVFLTIFGSYAIIAFAQGQYDLATFIAVLMGALLAYLWFNIPPARFFMGETGILGLTTTLTVIAFLTNAVVLLPIAGIVLVLESGSVILQLVSKKLFGKKVFRSAPIHHHFEAVGWPAYKVTMRLWIVSAVFSLLALIIFFLSAAPGF